MDTVTYNEKRSFELLRISEEEATVLYALVNLNDEIILSRVVSDFERHKLADDEVQAIACDVRDKIMAMVNGDDAN